MLDNSTQGKPAPYGAVLIKLLRGPLYDEDIKAWNDLLVYQERIRGYFSMIGLELLLDEADGFAYLTQPEPGGEEARMPRLTRRASLTYEVTLLLVILRECLEEFDVKTTDISRCFITHGEIMEKIELLFKEKANRVKLLSKFDACINHVINLGFLKEAEADDAEPENRRFEIRRIIRARINNEKLEEIREKIGKSGEPGGESELK